MNAHTGLSRSRRIRNQHTSDVLYEPQCLRDTLNLRRPQWLVIREQLLLKVSTRPLAFQQLRASTRQGLLPCHNTQECSQQVDQIVGIVCPSIPKVFGDLLRFQKARTVTSNEPNVRFNLMLKARIGEIAGTECYSVIATIHLGVQPRPRGAEIPSLYLAVPY